MRDNAQRLAQRQCPGLPGPSVACALTACKCAVADAWQSTCAGSYTIKTYQDLHNAMTDSSVNSADQTRAVRFYGPSAITAQAMHHHQRALLLVHQALTWARGWCGSTADA